MTATLHKQFNMMLNRERHQRTVYRMKRTAFSGRHGNVCNLVLNMPHELLHGYNIKTDHVFQSGKPAHVSIVRQGSVESEATFPINKAPTEKDLFGMTGQDSSKMLDILNEGSCSEHSVTVSNQSFQFKHYKLNKSIIDTVLDADGYCIGGCASFISKAGRQQYVSVSTHTGQAGCTCVTMSNGKESVDAATESTMQPTFNRNIALCYTALRAYKQSDTEQFHKMFHRDFKEQVPEVLVKNKGMFAMLSSDVNNCDNRILYLVFPTKSQKTCSPFSNLQNTGKTTPNVQRKTSSPVPKLQSPATKTVVREVGGHTINETTRRVDPQTTQENLLDDYIRRCMEKSSLM